MTPLNQIDPNTYQSTFFCDVDLSETEELSRVRRESSSSYHTISSEPSSPRDLETQVGQLEKKVLNIKNTLEEIRSTLIFRWDRNRESSENKTRREDICFQKKGSLREAWEKIDNLNKEIERISNEYTEGGRKTFSSGFCCCKDRLFEKITTVFSKLQRVKKEHKELTDKAIEGGYFEPSCCTIL